MPYMVPNGIRVPGGPPMQRAEYISAPLRAKWDGPAAGSKFRMGTGF